MSIRHIEPETSPEQAEAWVARLRAPDCDEGDHARFEDWLALSPENITDYLAAERRHALMLELAQDPDILSASRWAWRDRPRSTAVRGLHYAVAASVTLTVALGTWLLLIGPAADPQHFVTSVGQQRSLTLADGTVVMLDTNSEIAVRFGRQREVQLLRGRAQFDVAQASAPFTVEAGQGRIRDIGTVFQVSRIGDAVNVALLTGRLEVDAAGAKAALLPGQQLDYDAQGRLGAVQPLDQGSVEAWTHGELVVKARPLSELLDQANLYFDRPVLLDDPQLEQIPISGVFRVGDRQALLQALATGWQLQAREEGGGTVLNRETR